MVVAAEFGFVSLEEKGAVVAWMVLGELAADENLVL